MRNKIEFAATVRSSEERGSPAGLLKLQRTPRCEKCGTAPTSEVRSIGGSATALCASCSRTAPGRRSAAAPARGDWRRQNSIIRARLDVAAIE